jgi:peptidoglycan/LPS O-acetylase OafA/YrhL
MLPWIDALRGLAILMVLANHVALVVPGLSAPVETLARFGQMGVQLFFVASAYTLCLSWQQRRADEAQPLLRFLLRRLFRIAPLYWFAIALFTVLNWLQSGGTTADAYSAANLLANAAFVHGVMPAAQNSIVPGGWSIGTEMAFYALFPALMALLGPRPGLRAPLIGAALALALNLLFQAGRPGPVANNSFAYFHPLNQLPVFLIGIALCQWHRRPPAQGGRPWPVTAIAGGAALLATALLWRSGLPWAFAVVPTTAGLGFAALADGASRLRWLPAPLCTIGRRSFAIYVVHVLFAWHALRWLGDGLEWRGDFAYGLSLAAVTLLSHIAAGALSRWIEQPGLTLGRRILAALPSQGPGFTRRSVP